MAAAKPITADRTLEYTRHPWGDLLYGTKQQLQALGIGAGLVFPGEDGQWRRKLRTMDPRGFPAEIAICDWHSEEGVFVVRIPLLAAHPCPQWPSALPHAPGVTKCESYWTDIYCGSATALVTAGVVRPGQFPGQPGMRKVRVRILPDGTVLDGPPNANNRAIRGPGGKCVQRTGSDRFRVEEVIAREDGERRQALHKLAVYAWELRVRALPRPAPLNLAPARRAHLQLVWTAPADAPGAEAQP